jgi:RHS repeat-associated protein
VTSATRADGSIVAYEYDSSGNMTSYSLTGKAPHRLTYDSLNQISSYTPPDVSAGNGAITFDHNKDRQITKIQYADGRSVINNYDPVSGKCIETKLPGGSYLFSYSPQSGYLATLTAPDGNRISFDYDGAQITQVSWSGTITGVVANTFDNNFRISSETVNGSSPISYQYDNDDVVKAVGSLALNTTRGQTGLTRETTLGIVTDSSQFDGFSELSTYQAKANSATLISTSYQRDQLGRITRKTETIDSATTTFEYQYDSGGRLTNLVKNGTLSARYTYDIAGNRLSAITPAGTILGSYDAQDRMMQYGDATYSYNDAGQLIERVEPQGTSHYNYDELGNLLGVQLPDGRKIDYVIDGRNRRIGKEVNGALVQGFLYHDAYRPVAELNAQNAVVSRFVYAGRAVRYMVRGADTFRIITDELGSPRLVVNSATGAVVQRMDYDEFGNVTFDSNPGFQPFGFAGGLYDRDTKLIRFGFRDYDAQTGRWTARELAGPFNGQDIYSYAGNDPINSVDPLGADPPGNEFDEKTIEQPIWDLRQAQNQLEQLKAEGGRVKSGSVRWNEIRMERERLSKLIPELRKKAQALNREANGAAHSGGILGKAMCLLNFIDLAQVAIVAIQNDHSFFEEIDIQDAAERAAAAEEGVHTIISCLGAICVTTELDEHGNRLQYDPISGTYQPTEL